MLLLSPSFSERRAILINKYRCTEPIKMCPFSMRVIMVLLIFPGLEKFSRCNCSEASRLVHVIQTKEKQNGKTHRILTTIIHIIWCAHQPRRFPATSNIISVIREYIAVLLLVHYYQCNCFSLKHYQGGWRVYTAYGCNVLCMCTQIHDTHTHTRWLYAHMKVLAQIICSSLLLVVVIVIICCCYCAMRLLSEWKHSGVK